ncbi:MAG TPA: hypothetical protein VIL74_09035 [Pyrinomonadaceae bacterium]|jgi:hypothetical protein
MLNEQYQNSPVADFDTSVRVPQRNLEGARYVFTVADLISDEVKSSNPAWFTLGGVLRPGAACLKWNQGYIPRCEITELKQYADSTAASNVHPEKREGAVRHYEIATVNPATGQFEERTIGVDKNGVPDGLLRKFFYPANDVATIAGKIDGVVEMPVTNNREKNLAQRFLFPNWEAIRQTGNLPPTVRALKEYFLKLKGNLNQADPHFRLFLGVVNAALKSCDDFAAWGARRVNEANAMYNTAKTKGWTWSYGDEAIKLFVQLGLPRQDIVAQEQAAQFDKLAESQTRTAENLERLIQLQTMQAQANVPAPVAQQTAPPVPKEVVEVVTDERGENSRAETETPSETETETETETPSGFAVERRVLVNGREAEILELKPGGNLKVQYVDGEKETVGVKRSNCQLLD